MRAWPRERSGVTVGRHLPSFAGAGMPSRTGATQVVVIALSLALSIPAVAQSPARSDGPYEAWSPLTMSPVGPLAQTRGLARWIDVRTSAGVTHVVFQPEGRVSWHIRSGPHGPIEKRVEVDGELFSTSRFEYDAAGHLTRKRAEGAGLPGAPWVFDYTTDASGRVLTRRHTLPAASPLSRGRPTPALEEQRIDWRGAHAVVTTLVDGREVRRDRYDRRGLLLETRWTAAIMERSEGTVGRHLPPSAGVGMPSRSGATNVIEPNTRIPFALAYRRDGAGALLAIERTFGGRRSAADPSVPDPRVASITMVAMMALPIERHEVQLLLGAAHTSSDSERGAARRIVDDYADGCWLNQPSALEYDAAGVLMSSHVQCICGFCVDASLPVEEDPADVEVTDLHFTRGPWIRLDGAIDVTAEHRVMTPRGPIAAGELRAGDEVITSGGAARVLRSVEPLGEGELRLGRNLRTRSGTFAAGGLLFESELPRECPVTPPRETR